MLNVAGPSSATGDLPPPSRNSMRALLSTVNRNGRLISPASREMYSNSQYGTQENIYEEIVAAEQRHRILNGGQSMVSLNQSMVEEEFRRVQNRHHRVLGELNLSVEAMLMPTTPPSDSQAEEDDGNVVVDQADNLEELLSAVGPTDELLSPVSGHAVGGASCVSDIDSGFSGSSSGASCVGSIRYRNTAIVGGGVSVVGRSSTPTGSGASVVCNTSLLSCGSARSSQRGSSEDPELSFRSNTLFGGGSRCFGVKSKVKSAEDPGPPTTLESTKKTSFWSRKGWRKLAGFSSTTSVHRAGLLNGKFSLKNVVSNPFFYYEFSYSSIQLMSSWEK